MLLHEQHGSVQDERAVHAKVYRDYCGSRNRKEQKPETKKKDDIGDPVARARRRAAAYKPREGSRGEQRRRPRDADESWYSPESARRLNRETKRRNGREAATLEKKASQNDASLRARLAKVERTARETVGRTAGVFVRGSYKLRQQDPKNKTAVELVERLAGGNTHRVKWCPAGYENSLLTSHDGPGLANSHVFGDPPPPMARSARGSKLASAAILALQRAPRKAFALGHDTLWRRAFSDLRAKIRRDPEFRAKRRANYRRQMNEIIRQLAGLPKEEQAEVHAPPSKALVLLLSPRDNEKQEFFGEPLPSSPGPDDAALLPPPPTTTAALEDVGGGSPPMSPDADDTALEDGGGSSLYSPDDAADADHAYLEDTGTWSDASLKNDFAQPLSTLRRLSGVEEQSASYPDVDDNSAISFESAVSSPNFNGNTLVRNKFAPSTSRDSDLEQLLRQSDDDHPDNAAAALQPEAL